MNSPPKTLYYEHSGRVGIVGPFVMAAAGLVSAVVLGIIYGYLLWFGFVIFNLFAPFVCGFLGGLVVSAAAKFGKVRNDKLVVWFGVVIGVFCVYAGWVIWLFAWGGRVQYAPTSMFAAMAEAAEEGVTTIFGWTPDSFILYAIWAIEALLIVGSTTLFAYTMSEQSMHPFCEDCNEWAESTYASPYMVNIDDPNSLKQLLEHGERACLLDLEAVEVMVPGTYSQLLIQACTKCRNFYCLDVKKVALSKNSKGKLKTSDSLLVDNLLISPDFHDALKERFGTFHEVSEADAADPSDRAG